MKNAENGTKMVVGVQYSEGNVYDADIDSNHQSGNSDSNHQSGNSDSRSRDVEVQSNDSFVVQRPSEGKRLAVEKFAVSKGNTRSCTPI